MAALAALCGVMIVVFGLFTAGRAPNDVRLGIEVTCFVGGLVLCFIAVVLARLRRLDRTLDALTPQSADDIRSDDR